MMSQVHVGYGSRESLDLVLGTWEDKSRSTYKVELDATGYSCSVLTVRPSGEKLQTHGLIRLVDKPDGRVSCIHWGKMFALDLESASSSTICWKHIDNVKDFHWWRSNTAEIVSSVAHVRKLKSGHAHSWHDMKTAKYEDALQAWGVSSSQTAASYAHRSPWPSWSEVQEKFPLSEMVWPAWARLEENTVENSSAGSSMTVTSPDTRSKLLEFLLARPELLPRRKELLRQCVGGYFAGHIVHEGDVEHAIAAAEERLCNVSDGIYETSLPGAYLSAARDVASVTTSPGATNEGDVSFEASENEVIFDPLGRAVVSCAAVDDAVSDISSEHFA